MDLKVKIVTEADLAALQNSQKSFKSAADSAQFFQETLKGAQSEQDKAGKSAKDSASAYEELLGPVKKNTTAAEEAEKAVGKLSGSKKVLKESLKELAHAFPGVGSAMVLLKNPITILVGALATAVTSVRSYMLSVEELARSVGVHEAVSRTMQTLGGAARDAATGLRQFKTDMDDAATSGTKFVDKMKEVQEAIDKAALRETEKRDANEALAIAKANASEKGGKITPQQAIQQRLNITNDFAAQREAARKKAEADKLEAKGEALTKIMESRVRAEALLPAALEEEAGASRTLDAAPDKQKSDLKELDDQEADATNRREKLQKKRSAYEPSSLDWLMPDFLIKDSPVRLAAIDEDLDRVGEDLKGIENKRAMVNREPALAKKRAETTGKRATGLKDLITGAKTAEGGLFEDIVYGQQQMQEDQRSRERAGALQAEARGVTAGADIRAKNTQDATRIEADLPRAYHDLSQSFGGYHGQNVQKLGELKAKIDELTGQLRSIESRR